MERREVSATLVREMEPAVEAPVRDLLEVLNCIRADAVNMAPQYLKETEVPYGGE